MTFQTRITEYLTREVASKTVVLVGLASEGYSSYSFLRQFFPSLPILATDDRSLSELGPEWQAAFAQDSQLTFVSAKQLDITTLTSPLFFKTPGIPHTHQLIQSISQYNAATTSNTGLFLTLIDLLPQEERPTTIGITGTKGKSTTTSLISTVLKASGRPTFLAGNIGVPALDVMNEIVSLSLEKVASSFCVIEMSSHQLLEVTNSPHIAVIQNITPEHLDYYQSFEEYWQAKARIVRFQTATDIVVFDPDFEVPSRIAEASPAQKWTYSLTETKGVIAWTHDGTIYYKDEPIMQTTAVPLVGSHNILNCLPAVIIAKKYGMETTTIVNAIKSFQALPHRLEFVTEKNGVRYYNDSQGTTPEATIAALKSFHDSPITLLAGGSDKGISFTELAQEIMKHQVKKVVLFPPTGEKIAAELTAAAHALSKDVPQLIAISSMKEAVTKAAQYTEPGEIVLLSPACASFGMFKNYKDRGEQFKAAVHELA